MESGLYCSEDEKNAYVVFGGKINTVAAKDDEEKIVAILLQELDKKLEIGTKKSEDWDKEKPTIHLIFNNTKSIDVLIDLLQSAKQQLNNY